MAGLEESTTPHPSGRSARKTRWIVLAIVAAVFVACYLGLCGYVTGSGRILPNTWVSGVALGNMTRAEATQASAEGLDALYSGTAITLICDEDSIPVPAALFTGDGYVIAQAAYEAGRSHGFFWQGATFVRSLFFGTEIDAALCVRDGCGDDVSALLAEVSASMDSTLAETTWEVSDTVITFVKGHIGRAVDTDALLEQICDTLAARESSSLLVTTTVVSPAELDFDALYAQLYVEPADAFLDPVTFEITPHVTGVSFQVDAAKRLMDAAEPGETFTVPLILTEPEHTTQALTALLFRDVLGTCSTTIGGTASRLTNVTLAASFCDGVILFPGESFSYNSTVGPRTTERGFSPAPAYRGGETVDEVGGGICQVSSTLYLAALRANLSITDRRNHTYISAYIEAGMDATVAYGVIDFCFLNDTDSPVKLVLTVNRRTLTVRILGTETDGITAEMSHVTLSSTSAGVVYKADSAVRAGTTEVSTTPYNGYVVDTYRSLYDESGALLSKTLESHNVYKVRNKVVLYNPADGDPSAPKSTQSAAITETPVDSESPAVSQSPVGAEIPAETPAETPTETQPPAVPETPAATESPAAEPPAQTQTPTEGD